MLAAQADDGADVELAQVAVEAVAAEEETVAREELHEARVDLDVVAVADGARDHVSMRRLLRLLGGDEALLQLPRDEGVILGQLLHLGAADAVDAAVAHLRGDGVLAEDQHGADGGAHPALAAVHLGHREDHVGRRLHGALHEATGVPDVLFLDGILELVEVRDAALDHAIDGLDRLLARHLTGRVPTHAVGDDVEAEHVVQVERVFVRLALAAQVAESRARAPQRGRGRFRGHRHRTGAGRPGRVGGTHGSPLA